MGSWVSLAGIMPGQLLGSQASRHVCRLLQGASQQLNGLSDPAAPCRYRHNYKGEDGVSTPVGEPSDLLVDIYPHHWARHATAEAVKLSVCQQAAISSAQQQAARRHPWLGGTAASSAVESTACTHARQLH